jgi:hypothetical protein
MNCVESLTGVVRHSPHDANAQQIANTLAPKFSRPQPPLRPGAGRRVKTVTIAEVDTDHAFCNSRRAHCTSWPPCHVRRGPQDACQGTFLRKCGGESRARPGSSRIIPRYVANARFPPAAWRKARQRHQLSSHNRASCAESSPYWFASQSGPRPIRRSSRIAWHSPRRGDFRLPRTGLRRTALPKQQFRANRTKIAFALRTSTVEQNAADADSPADSAYGWPQQEMGEPRSGDGGFLRLLQILPCSWHAENDAGASGGIDDGNMEPGEIACRSEPGEVKLGEGHEASGIARSHDIARITLLESAGAL